MESVSKAFACDISWIKADILKNLPDLDPADVEVYQVYEGIEEVLLF